MFIHYYLDHMLKQPPNLMEEISALAKPIENEAMDINVLNESSESPMLQGKRRPRREGLVQEREISVSKL